MCLGETEIIKRFKYGEGSPSIKTVLPKKLVKTNTCLGKTEIIKRFKYGEGSPSIKTVLPKKLVKTNVNDIQIIQGISG